MDCIALTGAVDPSDSFALCEELEPLTSRIRPSVTVDLTTVDDLHPSVVSVLIRHRRQARRQGGDLHVLRPAEPAARRTLDRVGLVGSRR